MFCDSDDYLKEDAIYNFVKEIEKSNADIVIGNYIEISEKREVIKTKIEKYFPKASKIPGSGYILKLLPSYGGNWEQYYEIRMEWKK